MSCRKAVYYGVPVILAVILAAILVAMEHARYCRRVVEMPDSFSQFYGIPPEANHFTAFAAEHSSVPYIQVWPLKQNVSFFVFGAPGSGKSSLRSYIQNTRFKPSETVVLEVLSSTMQPYIENLLDRACGDMPCPPRTHQKSSAVFAEKWSSTDLAHVLLVELTHKIIHELPYKPFPKNLPESARMDIISILCFFDKSLSVEPLEKLVNKLIRPVNPGLFSIFPSYKAKEATNFNRFQLFVREKRSIQVLDESTVDAIHLLYAIYQDRKHDLSMKPSRLPFSLLSTLVSFVQQVHGKRVAIVIDGLDENTYLQGSPTALFKFIGALADNELQAMLLSGKLVLAAFFPFGASLGELQAHIPEMASIRYDKLQILNLEWDENALSTYGAHLVDDIRLKSSNECAILPDFNDLVKLSSIYSIAKTQGISVVWEHPRHLLHFMSLLVKEIEDRVKLNKKASLVPNPFVATDADIERVLQGSAYRNYPRLKKSRD